MHQLDEEIRTAFQATSLVLVFVTVLFGLRYDQIKKDIDTEISTGEHGRRDDRHRLIRSLGANCLPLLVVNALASYLFGPLFLRILTESRFVLWNFDFARTAFVLISIFVFFFLLWSCYLAARLVVQTVKTLRRS